MFESGERQELNYTVLETRIAAKGFSGKVCGVAGARTIALRGSGPRLACAVTEWILKSCVTLFLSEICEYRISCGTCAG